MNRCTEKGLKAWITFMRNLPRKIFNPCGSARIRGVSASGTHDVRGQKEYEDLTLRFTLDVYDFEPYEDPSAPRCRGAS
jgi:hypothetical protein